MARNDSPISSESPLQLSHKYLTIWKCFAAHCLIKDFGHTTTQLCVNDPALFTGKRTSAQGLTINDGQFHCNEWVNDFSGARKGRLSMLTIHKVTCIEWLSTAKAHQFLEI